VLETVYQFAFAQRADVADTKKAGFYSRLSE
jgi:hypothetical protein